MERGDADPLAGKAKFVLDRTEQIATARIAPFWERRLRACRSLAKVRGVLDEFSAGGEP